MSSTSGPGGSQLASVVDQALPGIGHRYELRAADGSRVVVVIHHSGRRDLYSFAPGGEEPQAVVTLTDTQARTLGAILGGAHNLAAGLAAARVGGFRRLAAANIGLTLLGRGEFSLILATLAAAGLDDRIGPFVALYVLVLAVVGPVLTAHSRLVAARFPERLLPGVASP